MEMAHADPVIRSVKDLIDLHSQLGSGVQYWFRGQADKNYTLIPSLYRNTCYAKREREMLSEFKHDALLRTDFCPKGDWEWMVLAQHYGIPTRLLDWTQNPLQALFFAVAEQADKDGCLFILNPKHLNQIAFGAGTQFPLLLDDDNSILNDYEIDARERQGRLPAAVVAFNNFPRIGAQKGTFTLFPTIDGAVNGTLENECMRQIIPRESKVEIMSELRFVCIDESSSYPDLDHLAKRIRESYDTTTTSI